MTAEPAEAGSDRALATCWRCGRSAPRDQYTCPFCQADRRHSVTRGAPRRRRQDRGAPLAQVLTVFALLLLTSLAYGAFLRALPDEGAVAPRPRAQSHLRTMFVVEAIDTVLIVGAVLVVARSGTRRAPSAPVRVASWVAAPGVLLATLAANAAYHALLHAYVGGGAGHDPVVTALGMSPPVILLYCAQPAIVEELFFRFLFLDTLQSFVGPHTAVALSALAFGLAHIGVPLSIPMLGLIGVPLAYLRLGSGGLALPMLFHFLHNFCVLMAS